MSTVREPLQPKPLPDREGQAAREVVRSQADGASLVLPSQPIQEVKLTGNVIILASGEHGGARLTRPDTTIIGAADTRIVRLVDISCTCAHVAGIRFQSSARYPDRNNGNPLVRVRAGARVIFEGCTFEKEDPDLGDHALVDGGGFAAFLGCTFLGGITGGTWAVNHVALPIIDVFIAGGTNLTAHLHNNCTIGWEM